MGLGLTVWYPVGKGKGTDKKSYENYFRKIASIVPDWETESYFDENGFCVKIVPFEEDVYGSWEDGMLCISAKTSSAGPGYHAYLVELLDRMGIDPLEVEDETEYYEHRDFERLQSSMMGWLKALSKKIIEMAGENYSILSINMPLDTVPAENGRLACCPLGYIEKEFFERAERDEVSGQEFFVWWNEQQDAKFYKNCAMSLMWCDINWLVPETEVEQRAIRAVLSCLEKAYSMDSKQDYPTAEWMELAQLSEDQKSIKKLKTIFGEGGTPSVGYLRKNINSSINGWRIEHSGMMHYELDDNGTKVWWDDDMTIRASTITVKFNEDVENKSESLLKSVLEGETDYERFSPRNKETPAAIQHVQIEEDGELLWQTRLFATSENVLLIISIYYPENAFREKAIEICSSVVAP